MVVRPLTRQGLAVVLDIDRPAAYAQSAARIKRTCTDSVFPRQAAAALPKVRGLRPRACRLTQRTAVADDAEVLHDFVGVVGNCPECEFPIKDNYPLTSCPKCGKDLPDELVTEQVKHPAPGPPRVVVTDIGMPFGSMVLFMVKWTIATIPAFLVLFVLAIAAWSFFGWLRSWVSFLADT
jgi:hypothetical protein